MNCLDTGHGIPMTSIAILMESIFSVLEHRANCPMLVVLCGLANGLPHIKLVVPSALTDSFLVNSIKAPQTFPNSEMCRCENQVGNCCRIRQCDIRQTVDDIVGIGRDLRAIDHLAQIATIIIVVLYTPAVSNWSKML